MADGTQLGAPSGVGDVISTDDLGTGQKVQRVKVQYGADGSATDASTTNPLPVNLTNAMVADGGTLPAQGVQVGGTDGSVFQVLSTDNAGRANVNVNGTVPVSDGGGSLTVDGSVTADTELTTADLDTGAGTDTRAVVGLVKAKSGGAVNISDTDPLPVSDAGGTLSVDDGGGSLTVDGTVGVSGTVTVDSELTTADLDTGAGTDTRAVVGLVIAKSGGAANISNTDPLPISDAGGSVTVDGTVTSTLSSTTNAGATAKTSDYDTGAGTDTVTSFGIALPASGGAVQGGTATNPVRTDPTGTTTQPVSGTVSITANSSVNVAQVAGTTTDTNSGNKSAGTQRMVLATDQPQLTNALKVDGSAVTQPVSGTVTANLAPTTSGGLTVSHIVSAASTNATVVKASAGQLYGWMIYNSNAAARKVAFHNSASSPTAGASIFFTIVIPPTSAANVEFTQGIAFSSGIAVTMVTGLADSDTTAVAANDLVCNLFYK